MGRVWSFIGFGVSQIPWRPGLDCRDGKEIPGSRIELRRPESISVMPQGRRREMAPDEWDRAAVGGVTGPACQ